MLRFGSMKLNCKGQSIVEIGLMTPILLVALYVPADFGIAMLTAHLTQNAVREAARIGVSTKDPFDNAAATAIRTEALNRMPARLTSKTATVTYYATGAADCLSFVEVTGQGSYDYFLYQIMRLFGATVTNSVQIARTSRMRYEFQPVTNVAPICASPTVSSP